MMNDNTVKIIPEYELSTEDREKCFNLIKESHDTPSHTGVMEKQKPSFRIINKIDNKVISHMAIEFRDISINGELITIYGVKDVCVSKEFQRKGYATQLVVTLQEMMKDNGVGAIFLFAPDKKLYIKNKFTSISISLRWTFIQNGSSLGILERVFEDDCMIYPNKDIFPKNILKQIKKKRKLNVDLLGHVF